ncbi:MAG: O-antigen ligase family protein [Burkholderiales bacterium]|nr:O-antigen ligase family protein [Burkholderiales bacterium]
MPNHLIAYAYILLIGGVCYSLGQAGARKIRIESIGGFGLVQIGKQYGTAWLLLTSALFLSFNYYIFLLASIFVVFMVLRRIPREAHAGLYVVLLLSVPALSKDLPGIFGLNRLFDMSWPIMLGFIFLFRGNSGKICALRDPMDWVVLLLFLWVGVLSMRGTTFTDGLRDAFLFLNSILIPYFLGKNMSSRSIHVKYMFFGLVFIITILAGIAIFGSLRHWQIYDPLKQVLELNVSGITNYKSRSGILRSGATMGAIQFAAISGMALIVYLHLTEGLKKSIAQKIVFILIALAMIVTFSRAPWLVCVAMVGWYMVMKHKGRGIVYVIIGGVLFAAVLAVTGVLGSVIDGFLLKDSGNVDYRKRLLDVGVGEIMKYPLAGNPYFRQVPEMQVLRQGEGIIDIVNTYLQIGLEFGIFPVVLFGTMIFLWPMSLYRMARRSGSDDRLDVARTYMVLMVGLGLSIFTVSSFSPGSGLLTTLMFFVGVGHGIKKN